ncbi:unnamed protein product [Brachionus calyciflorus]|uniref:TLC domain-containing protein n=1 Tax=Brachionus calyciflorus TaxID=104777 RepID=A0A813MCT2_9BILA|nr:unnamed protein product [Brachionus calyciflorus]
MFWNLAVVRAIFGFIGSSLCFYEHFFDKILATNVAKATTVQSSILVSCLLGFFTFEVLAQILFDVMFKTFSKALHAHHFVSIMGFLITHYYNLGHYFPVWVFTLEFSTLFSCICFCLIKCKMADSLFWKINQIILVKVFHTRTFIEFTILYEIYYYWDVKSTMPFIWNLNLIFGLLLLGFFLTPYWTYRKTEQFFKKSDWNDTDKKQN